MPSGGTLAIRTREKDAVVRIEVSAQGASLSAEDCRRLFVPAGSAPEGMTGLGLATTQAVVTDHGGRISAESAHDGTTTFRLEFPAAPAGAVRPAPPPAAIQPQPEPPVAARPAEPVQVTIVATEAGTTSGEANTAPEASSKLDKLDKPSDSASARRGLTFTE